MPSHCQSRPCLNATNTRLLELIFSPRGKTSRSKTSHRTRTNRQTNTSLRHKLYGKASNHCKSSNRRGSLLQSLLSERLATLLRGRNGTSELATINVREWSFTMFAMIHDHS